MLREMLDRETYKTRRTYGIVSSWGENRNIMHTSNLVHLGSLEKKYA